MVGTVLSIQSGVAGSPSLLIQIQNPQVKLNLFPGQSTFYTVIVHNGMLKLAKASFQAIVISTPSGALTSEIHLVFPQTLFLSPGNTRFNVMEYVRADAPTGTYTIANTVIAL